MMTQLNSVWMWARSHLGVTLTLGTSSYPRHQEHNKSEFMGKHDSSQILKYIVIIIISN